MTSGHLFLVLGDIGRIHCDAWLLPCDAALNVTPQWQDDLPYAAEMPPPPADWGNDGVRTFRWDDWPGDSPQAWLTNVDGTSDPDWHVDGAAQFIQKASESLAGVKSRAKRSRPLLAMPLVGTGAGGAGLEKGGIASQLVPRILFELRDNNVDVVLVVRGPQDLAACQGARHTHESWERVQHLNEARRLASLAPTGQLALFLGAGVSIGAGLPDWGGRVDQLAEDAGYEPALREELSKLSFADYAQLIQRDLPAGKSFRQRIAELVHSPRHSLCHALLATLPVREAVTQNYDTLFEAAVEGATGKKMSVIPYAPVANERWLLKMHGCRTRPDDIVLNRQDYLRYQQRRGALAGLVQGPLLTKHLAFIGFSLKDENFIALLDEVRQARDNKMGRLATAIVHHASAGMRKLWADELDLVCFEDGRDGRSLWTALRRTARRRART